MKTLLVMSLLLMSSSAVAAECITTARGRTVCRDAAGAVVAGPPQAAVVAAPRPVVVAPTTAVVSGQRYEHGVTTVQGGYGAKAAYNPATGNAAVSQKNANGVTTTQTSRGGEAKTKNGMGVVQGPGGKTCAKGRGEARCN